MENVNEKSAMNVGNGEQEQPANARKSLKDVVSDGLEEKGKGKDMWLW